MTALFGILLFSPPSNGASSGSDPIGMFLPLILIGAVFYFMILRPQKKRQKEREGLLSKMSKGDKVITSSGIHGTIASIDDGTLLIQVAENIKLRFEKSSVTQVITKD